jgi:hypothetical protein
MPNSAAYNADLLAMRVHLPFLVAAAQSDPNTPQSVINFINYLSGQVNR